MIDLRTDFEKARDERNIRICELWKEISEENPNMKRFRLATVIGREVGVVPLTVLNIVKRFGLMPDKV